MTNPTDHDLLRWVAEELLGWKHDPGWHNSDLYWWRQQDELYPNRREPLNYFQSWHGIGLVVEAMEKRDLYLEMDSGAIPGKVTGTNYRASFWNAEMKDMMNITVWGPWDDLNDEGMYVMSEKPWFAVFHAARKAVEQ